MMVAIASILMITGKYPSGTAAQNRELTVCPAGMYSRKAACPKKFKINIVKTKIHDLRMFRSQQCPESE